MPFIHQRPTSIGDMYRSTIRSNAFKKASEGERRAERAKNRRTGHADFKAYSQARATKIAPSKFIIDPRINNVKASANENDLLDIGAAAIGLASDHKKRYDELAKELAELKLTGRDLSGNKVSKKNYGPTKETIRQHMMVSFHALEKEAKVIAAVQNRMTEFKSNPPRNYIQAGKDEIKEFNLMASGRANSIAKKISKPQLVIGTKGLKQATDNSEKIIKDFDSAKAKLNKNLDTALNTLPNPLNPGLKAEILAELRTLTILSEKLKDSVTLTATSKTMQKVKDVEREYKNLLEKSVVLFTNNDTAGAVDQNLQPVQLIEVEKMSYVDDEEAAKKRRIETFTKLLRNKSVDENQLTLD
jgi:hypothetical protein